MLVDLGVWWLVNAAPVFDMDVQPLPIPGFGAGRSQGFFSSFPKLVRFQGLQRSNSRDDVWNAYEVTSNLGTGGGYSPMRECPHQYPHRLLCR